jgi:hypothetical protein
MADIHFDVSWADWLDRTFHIHAVFGVSRGEAVLP